MDRSLLVQFIRKGQCLVIQGVCLVKFAMLSISIRHQHFLSRSQRQLGLFDAARAGEGEEAHALIKDEGAYGVYFIVPTDEGRGGSGQVVERERREGAKCLRVTTYASGTLGERYWLAVRS